jgi:AcrR family transcriptional regulator
MEATVKAARNLDGDKAQRIVAAMRASVGNRGAAASTFDHVAQAAGVSRGLLHYYFQTKERLLVEVVRHDCDIRLARLEEQLAGAASVDALVAVLVSHLEALLYEDRDPATYALLFEMFTASRHNAELRREMAALYRQVRGHVAEVLAAKEREGVVRLRGGAEAVASVLFALGDGVGLQVLSDPEWDSSEAFAAGMRTTRFLLGAES